MRADRGNGVHSTTKQKGGKSRRGHGLSSYSVKGKGKKAERYNRPYLDGSYDKEA